MSEPEPQPEPQAAPTLSDDLDAIGTRPARSPTLLVILAVIVVGGGGIVGGYTLYKRPSRAFVLFHDAIPDWVVHRSRSPSAPVPAVTEKLRAAAAKWPEVAAALLRVDAAYPDADAVEREVQAVNAAAQAAQLPYFVDVQRIRDRPVLLTYEAAGRFEWRAGDRKTTALRLRRLDRLNVEMGLFGETPFGGEPRVLLDRIEAALLRDLPIAYGKAPDAGDSPIRAAALLRLRKLLDAKVGPAMQAAAERLARREALFESMRKRLHDGTVQMERPERFVFGDAWFDDMRQYTSLTNPGGPLILDTDLREVWTADEALRDKDVAAALQAALDLMSLGTEAHEVRHAVGEKDEKVPAPLAARLADDPPFAQLAEREVRAYLGEMHDADMPVCMAVIEAVQGIWGPHASRTPHFFARRVILASLVASLGWGVEIDADPIALMNRLCDEPDAALREHVAAAWKELYGAPLVPATRGQPGSRS